MTSGGKKPPSPPAAPTTPVTAPTRSAGDHAGDEGEHRARAGAERRGHAEERAGGDRQQRRLERDDRGEHRDDAERDDEHGDRVQPVGQPAADRAHHDGEHDEPGGAQRGVALVEVVGGRQLGGQVDAERDEAAERRPRRGTTAARSRPSAGCPRAAAGTAARDDLRGRRGRAAQRRRRRRRPTRTTATRSNGKLGPNGLVSWTVVNAEIAVPPMPMPKTPRRSRAAPAGTRR